MRILYTFIFFIHVLAAGAQGYFINFTGNGATSEVDVVVATNLATGEKVMLSGSYTLNLTNDLSVNPGKVPVKPVLMPNPFANETVLWLEIPHSGPIDLQVISVTGKVLCDFQEFSQQGMNGYRIANVPSGISFLRASGRELNVTTKLISVSASNDTKPSVSFYSYHPAANRLKSLSDTIEMTWHEGDRMLYKGITGKFKTIITDIPAENKIMNFTFIPCTDKDSVNYTIVDIGGQYWMAENLNAGKMIASSYDQSNNGVSEKYCYDNKGNKCGDYGGLYQFNEVVQYSSLPAESMSPVNWHLPTLQDWTKLIEHLGGLPAAGGELKETGYEHWSAPNAEATNTTGFSALPGGSVSMEKQFGLLGLEGHYWTASGSEYGRYSISLGYDTDSVIFRDTPVNEALSVRCVYCTSVDEVTASITAIENPVLPYSPVSFVASVVNGGTAPRYQWHVNGQHMGTNSPSFTYMPKYGDEVFCEITSNQLCVSGNPAASNRINVSIHGQPCPGMPTIEYEGQVYNTVLIGDKCWLASNLNVGLQLLMTGCTSKRPSDNGIIEKFCPSNNEFDCLVLGGIYPWDEMMDYMSDTTGPYIQGICPCGWHLPSIDDFCELIRYSDPGYNCSDSISAMGYKLKETGTTHWNFPNYGATNEVGFNAVAAGRLTSHYLWDRGDWGFIWTPNVASHDRRYVYRLFNDSLDIRREPADKSEGYSVRCVKDE